MCGVAGYCGLKGDAVAEVLRMQIELEGRGPHSAGVAVWAPRKGIKGENRLGTASHLAQHIDPRQYRGRVAIGHNRYATRGSLADAQPLVGEINGTQIAIGINGQTVKIGNRDTEDYRKTIKTVFRASSDSETMFHVVSQMPRDDLPNMLAHAMMAMHGAWSLVALIGDGRLVAMRDPWAFRPLWLGQNTNGYAIASEDCAFGEDITAVREIAPGEMLCINPNLELTSTSYRPAAERLYRCVFEDTYFKRETSHGVWTFRSACGLTTAEEMLERNLVPPNMDGVVPMLDSGRDHSSLFAHRLNLPILYGMNRTRLGRETRAFLGNSPNERLRLARQKHVPNPEVVNGKRVFLMEDSKVRGDTLIVCVKKLRHAGAREIHVVVASPPVINPCFYGIATPNHKRLIAAQLSPEEIRVKLGADSIYHLSIAGYQSNYHRLDIAGFRRNLRPRHDVCDACMTGDYPPFTPTGFVPITAVQTL